MFSGQVSIIGAGLSGLIAAHAWKRAQILESAPSPRQLHNALLRFRSDAVSRLVDVPFRKVTVRKAVVSTGQFQQPNLRLANNYARKVTGRISGDRSIWNLDSVERFIAPDDLYQRLINNVNDRIRWGCDGLQHCSGETPIVSTMPLHIMLRHKFPDLAAPVFARAPIAVYRYHVDADVFQTVYFPDGNTPVYRASITGRTLIVEAMELVEGLTHIERAIDPFGLTLDDIRPISPPEWQQYGKIVPIDDVVRKNLLHALTRNHNVYSLGRFATWRNILLDDVVRDIERIDAMLGASAYERANGLMT